MTDAVLEQTEEDVTSLEGQPDPTTQTELPFALVEGQPLTVLPDDLYIPPDALEVILEAFEGPLDLLLYLIKRQNLDILDIPIADITHQYMKYVELMKNIHLELAAEYLVMAAMLAEIKSRMLLPRNPDLEEDETDPRAELVRRLQEYERYKQAAEDLDAIPRQGRDIFVACMQTPDLNLEKPQPTVSMEELMRAFRDVLKRSELTAHHHIQREPLSVRERMTKILSKLQESQFCKFESLFSLDEGKLGVVVSFMAILELVKQSMIQITQTEAYSPIHISVAG
jgi:segregation and condensation protein A